MLVFFIVIAVIIGCLMPIQAGINFELTRFIKHPYLGAFVSFFMGTLVLGFIILFQQAPFSELKRLTTASPHLLLGGMMGALFVGSSIFLVPRMGATLMIGAYVTGQLLMSVVMDHYGLFGLTIQPITMSRLLGIFLLFVGLFLVVKKGA